MSKNTIFPNTTPILKQNVSKVIEIVDKTLQLPLIRDIGSAGFKMESNDIDLFIDEDLVIKHYKTTDVKEAKQSIKEYFKTKGFDATIKGRNVHIDVPYDDKFAQVDLMVIPNAEKVADWHQHGLRGMYNDPNFEAKSIYILLNSIGKYLHYKTDAFGGVVMRRDTDEVVADNRDDAAKLLLNPTATEHDLNSAYTILRALDNDPHRIEKLEQAMMDVEKGLLVI